MDPGGKLLRLVVGMPKFRAVEELRDDQKRSSLRVVVPKIDNALPFREQEIEETTLPMLD